VIILSAVSFFLIAKPELDRAISQRTEGVKIKAILMLQQVVYKTTALGVIKHSFSKLGCTSRMTGCYCVMDCEMCGPALGPLILPTEETRQI
jgi:hypothetical protein